MRPLSLTEDGLLAGGSALWLQGWTTQIHRLTEIILPEGEIAETAGLGQVRILRRDDRHFAVLRDWSIEADGRRMLRPEMAIADALVHRGDPEAAWLAAPDDIDPDAFETDRMPELLRALDALGAGPEVVAAAAGYADALDPARDAPAYRR
ncbi:hypothetical protein [Defluviimonas salinarum]|uniref:Uncharacterized protein n=1 Tax=Defluviimonas salinarum TaxID=2992147 RepID=A0ABT3J6D7_9RHOB|nr:hypothetical protein [Defluviimonas salinarum]MCW3782964.1 hypothetical protein [Defluviimonas salinarum]